MLYACKTEETTDRLEVKYSDLIDCVVFVYRNTSFYPDQGALVLEISWASHVHIYSAMIVYCFLPYMNRKLTSDNKWQCMHENLNIYKRQTYIRMHVAFMCVYSPA